MNKLILALLSLWLLASSGLALACGTNPNALIQGPFKAQLFQQGEICFQWSEDHRIIEFYADIRQQDTLVNKIIDSYEYSDGPVELLSVFFTTIRDKPYIMVLLRWSVDYKQGDNQYQYFYKIKAYQRTVQGYQSDPSIEQNPALSGYQIVRPAGHGSAKLQQSHQDFVLKDANKIRQYLHQTYR